MTTKKMPQKSVKPAAKKSVKTTATKKTTKSKVKTVAKSSTENHRGMVGRHDVTTRSAIVRLINELNALRPTSPTPNVSIDGAIFRSTADCTGETFVQYHIAAINFVDAAGRSGTEFNRQDASYLSFVAAAEDVLRTFHDKDTETGASDFAAACRRMRAAYFMPELTEVKRFLVALIGNFPNVWASYLPYGTQPLSEIANRLIGQLDPDDVRRLSDQVRKLNRVLEKVPKPASPAVTAEPSAAQQLGAILDDQAGPVSMDEIMQDDVPWHRVQRFFKDIHDQRTTVPIINEAEAIDKHLVTDYQRSTIAEEGLPLTGMIKGNWTEEQWPTVKSCFRDWNSRLGWTHFGTGS